MTKWGFALPCNVVADGWVEPAQKTNLDKSDSQPSPFDKLRAGSTGLNLERAVLTQPLRYRFPARLDDNQAVKVLSNHALIMRGTGYISIGTHQPNAVQAKRFSHLRIKHPLEPFK